MTAEIAVLNKSAVALAADSTVTWSIGRRHKTYEGVNKLFTLSKHRPVGIMIYGNADFMGIPWESIIKEYRHEIGRLECSTLRGYVDAFLRWLRTSNRLFPEALQNQFLTRSARGYFRKMKGLIESRIAAEAGADGAIANDRIGEVAHRSIVAEWEYHRSFERLASADEDFEKSFIARHEGEVTAICDSVFEDLPINGAAKSALVAIVAAGYCRDLFSENASGIVIAGFGSEEIFPSVVDCSVETMVDDSLKWREEQAETIDLNCGAKIIPFAQRDIVDTFLTGVDPRYHDTVMRTFSEVLESSIREVILTVPRLLPMERDAALQTAKGKIAEIVASFERKLNRYSVQRHSLPIFDAASALPKDELAAMAESLVNLTSFRRKISPDIPTVGGHIDVAVISKGDGFIWVKRKHYFEAGKNPQYAADYYAER